MTPVVIDDIGIGMGRYLKTRTDLVGPERSPIRTVIFTIVALAGVALLVLAFTDPDMFESSSGRRRGMATIGMYLVPVVLIVLGIVGIIWWSRRWRVIGGGDKMRSAFSHAFTATDPNEVWAALQNATSAADSALVDVFRRIQKDNELPGAFSVDIMHSPNDRLAVATVTRAVQKKPGDAQSGFRHQLERDAVVRRGDWFIDFEAASLEALKG